MRAYYDAELPTGTDPSTNSHRSVHLRDFVDTCRTWHLESVLEVGCGAGHDSRLIRAAGLASTGVDLSAVGVGLCVGLSLYAVQASAINLPFRNRSFDAGWSMSTLMHLPGNDINLALTEWVASSGRAVCSRLEYGARISCIPGSMITAAISDS